MSFKAVLNNGLSDELKFAFPNLIPVIRPIVTYITPIIKNPSWAKHIGFVDAEGCFFVSLTNNKTGIGLIFKVTQHIRDTYLLKEFISYFNCGRYSLCSSKAGDYIVTKFSSINNNIIPFFNKYPILGSKSLDFSDFKKVAELIENKVHLTPEGFKFIKEIKSGMNKGRLYNKLDLSGISSNNVSPSSNYLKKRSLLPLLKFSEYCTPLIKKRNYTTLPSKARMNKVSCSPAPNKILAFNE